MRLVTYLVATWAIMAPLAFAKDGDDTAALRARASEAIAQSNLSDLFAPDDNGRASLARHILSGLACPVGPAGGNITVFDVPGVPRGDDVGCGMHYPFGEATLYATRLTAPMTDAELVAGAVQAMRTVNPALEPFQPPETATLEDGQPTPPSVTAAFVGGSGQGRIFTRVSVAVIDGWAFKMRFTSNSERASIYADILWVMTVRDIAAHPAQRAAPPPANGQAPAAPT